MPDSTAPPTPPPAVPTQPSVVTSTAINTAPPAVPPTTTTVATVTTTTTPASAAVPWFQSLKFRAYVGGWLTLVIGWAIENLTTHALVFNTWTWIALTVSTLLTVRSVVGDWMSPGVNAPFAVMNQNNVGAGK